jgi:4-oxalocrotonate tautomerase
MPYLHLQTVKGLLSPQQKRTLMDRFADLLVEIEGGGNPKFRKMVWIRIEEEEPEHWSLGEFRPDADTIARMAQSREANRKPQ